jgi:hypothetical protein
MYLVRRNNTSKLSNNFTEKEVFDASFGTDKINEFNISEETIKGWQIIRDWAGVPIKFTSSYRTKEHELSKGRSGNGGHPQMIAIDGVFLKDNTDNLLKFHAEIDNKGYLYKELRKAGISGIGLYDNFIHLDSRKPENNLPLPISDDYGKLSIWDNRTWTKKKS